MKSTSTPRIRDLRSRYTPEKRQAAGILDLVRAGVPVPKMSVVRALRVLGDLSGVVL